VVRLASYHSAHESRSGHFTSDRDGIRTFSDDWQVKQPMIDSLDRSCIQCGATYTVYEAHTCPERPQELRRRLERPRWLDRAGKDLTGNVRLPVASEEER
jgi:hypothetical protein